MYSTDCTNEKEAYLLGFSLNDININFEEVDPNSIDPTLVWHFIRGYFEGNKFELNQVMESNENYPIVKFSVIRASYLEKICNFLNFPNIYNFDNQNNLGYFEIYGTNALDLLGKLYDYASEQFSLENNVKFYKHWCRYYSSVFQSLPPNEIFEWCKTRENAIAPSKERVSDSGYDLTIIDIVKKFNSKTTLYTTGIKVKPPFGWYVDVVPRSSIIKTGYMLANNVGIIDRAYTGEIMIALIKVDETAPDLELPCRIAQMIPRRIAHFNFKEVSDIERTTRNDGGFGSTG